MGERVVVVIAHDETVKQVKSHATRLSAEDRRARVGQSKFVDEAHVGCTGDKYQIIEEMKPDIILLGYDQTSFTDRLAEELCTRGLSVDIRRAKAYHPEIYKSSKLYARH